MDEDDYDENLAAALDLELAQGEAPPPFPWEFVPKVSAAETQARKLARPQVRVDTVVDEHEGTPNASGRPARYRLERQERREDAPPVYEARNEPDVLLVNLDAPPREGFVFDLGVNFINITTKAHGSTPPPRLRAVAESVYAKVKAGRDMAGGDYAFTVSYLSASDERRLAGRHDKSKKTEREYEGGAFEKERKRRTEALSKSVTAEQLEILLFQMFENQDVVLLKDIRRVLKDVPMRKGLLKKVLLDIADPVQRGARKAYRVKSSYYVGVREEPGPLAIPQPDNTMDEILLWIDFEAEKMKRSVDLRAFDQHVHSMFIRGSGKTGNDAFEFSFHVFRNGSVRLTVGFREGRFKSVRIDDVGKGEPEKLARDTLSWFIRTFMDREYRAEDVEVSSVSMSGRLNKVLWVNLDAEAEKVERRERLIMQVKRSFEYTLAGLNPIGELTSAMPQAVQVYSMDRPEEWIGPYSIYQEDPPPKSVYTYARQHLERWSIEIDPHLDVRDLFTYDQFEVTATDFFKATDVRLKREEDVPEDRRELWRALDEGLSIPRYAFMTISKFQTGTSPTQWRFLFYARAEDEEPMSAISVPLAYASAFREPVPVTFWWSTGKLAMHASSDISPDPWKALKTSWTLLDTLFRRPGPGNLPPIVDEDRSYVDRSKPRKRGHERYALPKERPGRTKGTTCKPSSRIPNPVDPYDYDIDCRDGGIVMPDKQGFPCCFKRPAEVTQAYVKKVSKAYQKFKVPMPKRVMDFLGLTAFDPNGGDDTDADADVELDFDKKGRIRINKRLASRHHIKTVEQAATKFGLPTSAGKSKVSLPKMSQYLAWHAMVTQGIPGDMPAEFYEGLRGELPEELRPSEATREALQATLARLSLMLEGVRTGSSSNARSLSDASLSNSNTADEASTPLATSPPPVAAPQPPRRIKRKAAAPPPPSGPKKTKRELEQEERQRQALEQMERDFLAREEDEQRRLAMTGEELQRRYQRNFDRMQREGEEKKKALETEIF